MDALSKDGRKMRVTSLGKNIKLTYDGFLALRAAIHWRRTGKMLTPDEVAAIDPMWEADVFLMDKWIEAIKGQAG